MRSSILPAVLLAAILLAGAAEARVGVTSVTAGEPRGQPPAQAERVLRVGIDVLANERVTTGPSDRAHLVFLDASSISVGPNSALVIDKFVFDPDRNTGQMAITATRGVLRFVGGAISKGSEVEIKTPTATIGIRGGIADVTVGPTGETNAVFLYGKSMRVTGQGVSQVATRNGSRIEVPLGGQPRPPFIIPPGGMRQFDRAGPPPGQQSTRPPPQYQTQQSQQQPTSQPPPSGTTTTTQPTTTQQTQVQVASIDAALTASQVSKMNSGDTTQGTGPRGPGGPRPRGVIRGPAGPPIGILRAQTVGGRAVGGNNHKMHKPPPPPKKP